MLFLFQADTSWFSSNIALSQLLDSLPKSLHARALRYRFETDAYRFVLGRLLLQEGLKRIGSKYVIEQISLSKNGKPRLPGVHFNISHSGKLVICALTTEGETGLDIEEVKPVELDHFEAYFTPKEWSFIHDARQPLLTFYRYWTRKECILKATDRTLAQLHQVEIDHLSVENTFYWKGKQWHLKELYNWAGYCAAICSEVPIGRMEVIDLKESWLGTGEPKN